MEELVPDFEDPYAGALKGLDLSLVLDLSLDSSCQIPETSEIKVKKEKRVDLGKIKIHKKEKKDGLF